ncbi:MAG: hypothetical protein IPH35_12625 [Rhodoferax sp.]|nr:hypothetical protein [Rhodoferax sp.]
MFFAEIAPQTVSRLKWEGKEYNHPKTSPVTKYFSMKNPCPLCGERKAQRVCLRQNNAQICSICCAGQRDQSCGTCSYYAASQQYQAARDQQRAVRAASSDNQFINDRFVIEMNPDVDDAVDAALALCEQGNVDAAWAGMTRLRQRYPRSHQVCFGMGVLYIFKDEYEEAISWFDEAIAIYPYYVEAHFNRAAAYKNLFNIGETVRSFRKVVQLGDPNDTPVIQARSFLDEMTEVIRKNAGIDLESYIEALSLFDQAVQLMDRRDWSGALAGFRASAEKYDRNAPTHGNMGLCLANLGFKAQALAELDRALEIDPEYAPAMTNRVTVGYMEEGTPLPNVAIESVAYSREKFLDSLSRRMGKRR